MKNIFLSLFAIWACLSLSSCEDSPEERAQRLFDLAVDKYVEKNYNASKRLLDSLIFTYPNQKKMILQSRDMLKIVHRSEQERNLLYLDSLLQVREAEIKPLMDNFSEEETESNVPIYVNKRQTAIRGLDRSYIRAHVDKFGAFYISSHYTGPKAIDHYMIKATVGDSFLESDTVDWRNFNSYRHSFMNLGQYWEIVTFKQGRDNRIGAFIAANADKDIDITYIGTAGRRTSRLNLIDAEAVRDTYELSLLLRETVQLKSQIRNIKVAMQR